MQWTTSGICMIARRAVSGAGSILLTLSFARGQTAPPQKFDVASVKAYGTQDGNFMIRSQPDGTFRAVGATLKMLVMSAYDVKAFQVLNAPAWMGTELWEIQAKADASGGRPSRLDLQRRLQALLEERYQLKVHRERRTMPVYALVVAKSSGTKMTAATTNEQPGICPCGPALLTPKRASMAMLADLLSTRLWRVVIDKTGIKGEYAFNLAWTPASNEYGPEALGLPPGTGNSPPIDGANLGPSIFTALEEQLGLRLKSQKGPVEVIVVDRVERPSQN
jgi:uncharacterized protein (TIGR03435 family)